jgi:hypothetical protein
MRNFMKIGKRFYPGMILLLPFLLGDSAVAQHLISSKAGFVNRVEGKVYLLRAESQEGEEAGEKGRATLGTQMRDGDRLSTEAGGYGEILLNPGSYLRIDQKSEIRAVNTDLDRVRFELIRGSAMVEVGQIDKLSPIEIITPDRSFFIKKTGLQRIDIKGEMTLVAVRQGEIHLGTLEEVLAKKSKKIGRGKVAQLNGEPNPVLAKIDKDAVDEFDEWSFNRAEVLMAANQMALRRTSARNGILAFGWHFDTFHRCYTFIPRGSYWSPYGFGFFNSFNACYECYFPPRGYTYGNPGAGPRRNPGGNGPRGPGAAPRVVSGNDRGAIRAVIDRPRSHMDFDPSRGSLGGTMPSASSPSSRSGGGGGGGSRGGGSVRPPSHDRPINRGGGGRMPTRPRAN